MEQTDNLFDEPVVAANRPSKSWTFTLNNYSAQDVQRFRDFECSYLVIGFETGDSGTPHLQGYLLWKRSYRLTQLKKLVPSAHWEIAIVTDAMNYCMKENYEVIDRRTKGKRNDLLEAVTTLKESGLKKMKVDHPTTYVKFHSGLEKLWNPTKRTWKPTVTWIWGKTGVGKTKKVFDAEGFDIWVSGKNLRWWQGYEEQEVVLIDDFRADFCTFHELLRILDRYPYTVEVKGGSRQLVAKRMYITSCFPPDKVYDTREDIEQLLRRIDEVVCLDLPPAAVNGNFIMVI